MSFDKERARNVFLRYAEGYDTQNILIRHKIEHTLRVAELSERFAKALGMEGEDADFAWFLGLLHDIGRFEQVRRFGTFVDSQSVDHAELSGDILFKDGLIDRFSDEGLPTSSGCRRTWTTGQGALPSFCATRTRRTSSG